MSRDVPGCIHGFKGYAPDFCRDCEWEYENPGQRIPPKPKLRLVHVELAEANAFVDSLHRHHKKVVGHKFSLGAVEISDHKNCTCAPSDVPCPDAPKLVGVAIVGRPVARRRDDGKTLEVTRLCTDGTRNACSFLYGASARAAFALGYERIGTYTLQEEGGASLRASGWRLIGERSGGNWTNRTGRAIESTPNKFLWEVAVEP